MNPVNFNCDLWPVVVRCAPSICFQLCVGRCRCRSSMDSKAQLLDGWQVSGIVTFQTGFPVRITSSGRHRTVHEHVFRGAGRAELGARVRSGLAGADGISRKHGGFVFDPNQFTNATVAPGTIGNAPRSICCSPGINNWDMGFFKGYQIEREVAHGIPRLSFTTSGTIRSSTAWTATFPTPESGQQLWRARSNTGTSSGAKGTRSKAAAVCVEIRVLMPGRVCIAAKAPRAGRGALVAKIRRGRSGDPPGATFLIYGEWRKLGGAVRLNIRVVFLADTDRREQTCHS